MKEIIDFLNTYIDDEEDKLAEDISNAILKQAINDIADSIITRKEFEPGDIIIRHTTNSIKAFIVCSYSDAAIYTHMLCFYPNGNREQLSFPNKVYSLKFAQRKRLPRDKRLLYQEDFPIGWFRLSNQDSLYPAILSIHNKYFPNFIY